MEELEKIFKVLSTELAGLAPTVPAEQLNTLVGTRLNEVKNLVFNAETNARNGARAQNYGEIKKKFVALAPDVFTSISDDVKWEDMASQLVAAKRATKTEPTETPEQMRSRLQMDFDNKLKAERENMLVSSALNEIEATAIVNKLDDAYKGMFRLALQAELVPEVQGEKVVFKNKADGQYLSDAGTFATPKAIATLMLKKYPRLLADSKQSPQMPRGEKDGVMRNKEGKPLDRLGEGVKQLVNRVAAR